MRVRASVTVGYRMIGFYLCEYPDGACHAFLLGRIGKRQTRSSIENSRSSFYVKFVCLCASIASHEEIDGKRKKVLITRDDKNWVLYHLEYK